MSLSYCNKRHPRKTGDAVKTRLSPAAVGDGKAMWERMLSCTTDQENCNDANQLRRNFG